MTNLEFFGRALLLIFAMIIYFLFVFIYYSYNEHMNISINLQRDGNMKTIKKIYKENKDRFTRLPTYNDKYCYELLRRPKPIQNIHFYPYSIEVNDRETNNIYYIMLGFFDFILYMVYFYIIFRFTAKKPKQPLDLLKINNKMKNYN